MKAYSNPLAVCHDTWASNSVLSFSLFISSVHEYQQGFWKKVGFSLYKMMGSLGDVDWLRLLSYR